MRTRSISLIAVLVAVLGAIAVVHALRVRPAHAVKSTAAPGELTTGGLEDDVAGRDRWFFHQRAQPASQTPPGALERAVDDANAIDRSNEDTPVLAAPTSALAWGKAGPQPIATIGPDASANSGTYAGSLPVAGRVTTISPDPTSASVAYIGTANGGVWKTTDGGATWAPNFDTQPSLSVGMIVVDPSNTQNVWVGTGEPNSSGDSYYGAGIYKSTNGGSSWVRQGGSSFLQGCFVFDIAIVNSNTVLAAVADYPGVSNPSCSSSQRGIWRTINGGANWTHITLPGLTSASQLPTDFAQPTSPKTTVYTAVYNKGVWRSTDGGATWSQLSSFVPPAYSLRGALSVAPSNPAVLYVAYAANASFGQLSGVWKSQNANTSHSAQATFTQIVPLTQSNGACNLPNPPNNDNGQCTYDLDLAVDPGNSGTFYLGGIRLFKYTTSGSTVTGAPVAYGSCGTCIHVDQHAAVFGPGDQPALVPKLWIGSDGGVYNGVSPYTSFTNRNGSGNGALAITQFNGWTSGSIGATFIGGTQDNGTVKFTTSTGLNWNMTHGGDGGASAFQSANVFYASYFGKDVYQTLDGGSTYTKISGAWGTSTTGDGYEFYTPLEMSPASATTLYRGTDRIWRTTNASSAAPSWTAISPSFSPVTAIGPAKPTANFIYAGFDATFSSTGTELTPTEVRYTHNALASSPTWTTVTASNLPVHVLGSDRYVTDFSVSTINANTAYVSFSGFNASTPTTPGHIFVTTNGGANWTDVSGNLPDVPVDSIAVDFSKAPNVIYAGTDIGVFWSADGGATWGRGGPGTSGLPTTPDTDVRLDGPRVIAATHGRGVFAALAPSAIAVSSFSPTSGVTGSNVVISGTNLKFTKTVLFNGKISPAVTYSSSTQRVTAQVPDGATTGKITVQTAEGITATSASNFTPTLSVTLISPITGHVGSTVTLSGVGLSGITAVKFGGVAATTFSSGTGSSATAKVPTGAASGKISVTTPAGTVQSGQSFIVT